MKKFFISSDLPTKRFLHRNNNNNNNNNNNINNNSNNNNIRKDVLFTSTFKLKRKCHQLDPGFQTSLAFLLTMDFADGDARRLQHLYLPIIRIPQCLLTPDAVIIWLIKIPKICESRYRLLAFPWCLHFSPKISNFCYIGK